MATIKVKKHTTNDTAPSNLSHGEIGATQNLLWYGNSSGNNVRVARHSEIPTTASQVGAVAANSAITGNTHTKITYDSKGLVTGGANLAHGDIPDLPAGKITSEIFHLDRIPTIPFSKTSGMVESKSGVTTYGSSFLDTRAFIANNITTAGNANGFEYNILLNAQQNGITITQSGTGTISNPYNLCNGRLSPNYSSNGVDPNDPLVLHITGLPNTHSQTGGVFGWTSRYWNPTRYKIEGYNNHQGVGWKTWLDRSDPSNAQTAKDLIIPIFGTPNVGGGSWTEIKITIYDSNGSTGSNGHRRWGISEIYFIHPEAARTYQNARAGFADKLWTPRTISGVEFDGSSNITLTAGDVSAVPTTRTVNGKALSSDISLNAGDVEALASNHAASGVTTTKISNWDTAHTHAETTTGSVHGSTTLGTLMLRLPNNSTSDKFIRVNGDNTLSYLIGSEVRSAIGAGTGNSNLVLGTTSSTAHRGDHGVTAYNHSQEEHAPSNAQKNSDITKEEIEAKLTGQITTHTHAYALTNHSHGSISSSGTIGATADVALITTTGGTITTRSRSGIDSRSEFPPISHTHSWSEVTDKPSLLDMATNQTRYHVLAAPNNANGVPNFRALVASDIRDGVFLDARIPNLNASKITSGTLGYAILPVGTGAEQVAQGNHTHGHRSITEFATNQTQYHVYAAPVAGNGQPNFRALVPNDIPNFNASKITSGTLVIGVLPTGTTSNHVALGSHTHSNLVPTSRTINDKALTGNVTLTASDLGAEPAFQKGTAFNKNFGGTAGQVAEGNHTHAGTYVPVQRILTINGQSHSLTENRSWTVTTGEPNSIKNWTDGLELQQGTHATTSAFLTEDIVTGGMYAIEFNTLYNLRSQRSIAFIVAGDTSLTTSIYVKLNLGGYHTSIGDDNRLMVNVRRRFNNFQFSYPRLVNSSGTASNQRIVIYDIWRLV